MCLELCPPPPTRPKSWKKPCSLFNPIPSLLTWFSYGVGVEEHELEHPILCMNTGVYIPRMASFDPNSQPSNYFCVLDLPPVLVVVKIRYMRLPVVDPAQRHKGGCQLVQSDWTCKVTHCNPQIKPILPWTLSATEYMYVTLSCWMDNWAAIYCIFQTSPGWDWDIWIGLGGVSDSQVKSGRGLGRS